MSRARTPQTDLALSPERAALLAKRLRGELAVRGEGIPKRPVKSPTPLSLAQQRLWFLTQLELERPHWAADRERTDLRVGQVRASGTGRGAG